MSFKLGLAFFLLIAVLATLMEESSFVETADVKKKTDSSQDKSDSSDESTEDNSKEKKSGEEIMFGNQQNKAGSFVENMMGMSSNHEMSDSDESKRASDSDLKNETDNSEDDEDHSKLVEALKDDDSKHHDQDSSDDSEEMQHEMAKAAWYNHSPLPGTGGYALQYMLHGSPMQAEAPSDHVGPLYDRDEVYRRKRQLSMPADYLPLRKRSLRSPLGQMIQSRGRRLPRRSMRYKRQVKLEDILNLLGKSDAGSNSRFFDDQNLPSNPNPTHFRNSEFRYPFAMNRNEADDVSEDEEEEGELKNDLSNALLFSPPTRYPESPDYPFSYRPKTEDSPRPSQYPEWLDQEPPHTSMFSVSRRSSPFFYPLDYRYIPGYKKRNALGEKEDLDDGNFGKWGRVVQTPNEYASAEDVARLYALANLLAGGENTEERKRRSA